MELVTKLDLILMLIGIVGSTAETQLGTEVTPPSTISSVEPSTQDTTTTKTTMILSGNEQAETQLGTEVTPPSTISSVESSTQNTTTTKTTMTTSGNEQEVSLWKEYTSEKVTCLSASVQRTPGYKEIQNYISNRESKNCDDVFIFGGVGVALIIPITVIITLLLIWRRIGVGPLIICTKSDAHYSSVECNLFVKWAQCSRSIRVCWEFLLLSVCCCLKNIGTGPRKEELTGSDQVPRIVSDRNGTEQSNNADERDYDQPQWNRFALSEPIGHEMENTEYENVGSCSRSSYEGLHPYQNHGMNLYDSCSQQHILQEETEEIGV